MSNVSFPMDGQTALLQNAKYGLEAFREKIKARYLMDATLNQEYIDNPPPSVEVPKLQTNPTFTNRYDTPTTGQVVPDNADTYTTFSYENRTWLTTSFKFNLDELRATSRNISVSGGQSFANAFTAKAVSYARRMMEESNQIYYRTSYHKTTLGRTVEDLYEGGSTEMITDDNPDILTIAMGIITTIQENHDLPAEIPCLVHPSILQTLQTRAATFNGVDSSVRFNEAERPLDTSAGGLLWGGIRFIADSSIQRVTYNRVTNLVAAAATGQDRAGNVTISPVGTSNRTFLITNNRVNYTTADGAFADDEANNLTLQPGQKIQWMAASGRMVTARLTSPTGVNTGTGTTDVDAFYTGAFANLPFTIGRPTNATGGSSTDAPTAFVGSGTARFDLDRPLEPDEMPAANAELMDYYGFEPDEDSRTYYPCLAYLPGYFTVYRQAVTLFPDLVGLGPTGPMPGGSSLVVNSGNQNSVELGYTTSFNPVTGRSNTTFANWGVWAGSGTTRRSNTDSFEYDFIYPVLGHPVGLTAQYTLDFHVGLASTAYDNTAERLR